MTSSNVCSLLVTSSHNLAFSTWLVQGSPRSGAHCRSLQSFTTFYSSADPLLHRRPATNDQGPPHDYTSEPSRRGVHAEPDGSQTRQYESQVSRTQVQHAQFPLRPTLSVPAPQTAGPPHSTRALLSYPPIPPISSES